MWTSKSSVSYIPFIREHWSKKSKLASNRLAQTGSKCNTLIAVRQSLHGSCDICFLYFIRDEAIFFKLFLLTVISKPWIFNFKKCCCLNIAVVSFLMPIRLIMPHLKQQIWRKYPSLVKKASQWTSQDWHGNWHRTGSPTSKLDPWGNGCVCLGCSSIHSFQFGDIGWDLHFGCVSVSELYEIVDLRELMRTTRGSSYAAPSVTVRCQSWARKGSSHGWVRMSRWDGEKVFPPHPAPPRKDK